MAAGDVEAAKESLYKMKKLSVRLAQKKVKDNEQDNSMLHKSKLAIGRSEKHYTLLNSESVELGK